MQRVVEDGLRLSVELDADAELSFFAFGNSELAAASVRALTWRSLTLSRARTWCAVPTPAR